MNSLITIITPIYNSDKFIAESINSVLKQTYTNWELLLINDGSTDNSESIIKSFSDSRIKYFKQENKGVSSARNVGLKEMKGDYFCFLDSDDTFPENSLKSRFNVFVTNTNLSFVDGNVNVMNLDLSKSIRIFSPTFTGNPLPKLIRLDDCCFLGLTWMIKRDFNITYQFKEGLTHGEDLLFYISISKDKKYSFTTEPILSYRTGNDSAMSNLKGLETGYFSILKELSTFPFIQKQEVLFFKNKIKSIMFKSYLANKQIWNAIRMLFKQQ